MIGYANHISKCHKNQSRMNNVTYTMIQNLNRTKNRININQYITKSYHVSLIHNLYHHHVG